MQRLLDRLNRSPALSHILNFASTYLARYRGLPVLVGALLIAISWFMHLIAAASGSVLWYILAFSLLHLAILVGFLGILLAEPLGRG